MGSPARPTTVACRTIGNIVVVDFERALDHINATGVDRKVIRDAVEQLRRELRGEL